MYLAIVDCFDHIKINNIPVDGYAENNDPNIFATPRPNNCQVRGETVRSFS